MTTRNEALVQYEVISGILAGSERLRLQLVRRLMRTGAQADLRRAVPNVPTCSVPSSQLNCAAPAVPSLLPLFPAVVTGTIILVIGISLMRVGINWAGGGLPTLTKVVEGVLSGVRRGALADHYGP